MKDLLSSSKNRSTQKRAAALVQLARANPQVWLTLASLEDVLSGVSSYVKTDIKLQILLEDDEEFVNRNPVSERDKSPHLSIFLCPRPPR